MGSGPPHQTRNSRIDHGHRAADIRFLARDRAGQFTEPSDAVLARAGIDAVQIPPRSPRANAHARTVRAHRPDGGHRPDADLPPTTPAAGPSGVRGPATPLLNNGIAYWLL